MADRGIAALDGLRGLAVLLVLLSHLSGFGYALLPGLDMTGIGKAGVYLFFVLSAWLLSHRALAARAARGWDTGYWSGYLVRRVFRILPLYTLVLTFSVVTTLYGWDVWVVPLSWSEALRHLFMLEGRSVFWAIPVEFLFYALLPLVLGAAVWLAGRSFALALLLLLSLMILPLLLPWGGVYQKNTINLWAYWPVFMAGMALALVGGYRPAILERLLARHGGWLLVLLLLLVAATVPAATARLFGAERGLLPLLAGAITTDYFHPRVLFYGSVWSLVMACLLFGPSGPRRAFGALPLAWLGRVSFSVYLWHLPVLRGVKMLELNSPLASGWLTVLLALALAGISFRLVEWPAMEQGRQLAKRLALRFSTPRAEAESARPRPARG